MENNSTNNAAAPNVSTSGQVPNVATEKVTITKGDPHTDLWVHGHMTRWPDYTFVAKVFDAGSKHGIDGGRISKLEVRYKGESVMSYDRDWNQKPRSWKEKAVLREVVAAFPDSGTGPAKAKRGAGRGI